MLFTVIGIAVVSAMLIIFIKQYRPEYSMLTAAIAGAVLTAASGLNILKPTVSFRSDRF